MSWGKIIIDTICEKILDGYIFVLKYHITMVEINKMNYVRYLNEDVFSCDEQL